MHQLLIPVKAELTDCQAARPATHHHGQEVALKVGPNDAACHQLHFDLIAVYFGLSHKSQFSNPVKQVSSSAN